MYDGTAMRRSFRYHRDMPQTHRRVLTLIAGVFLTATVAAQQSPPALTADDYARAERFMSYNTTPLVLHSGVRPMWTSNNQFWYRTTGEKGAEAWLVDAARAAKAVCDLEPCKTAAPAAATSRRQGVTSPDGRKTAFIRDWNLWVRDVATNNEVQLTKDGVKDFGYATDNAGWTRSNRPIVRWSPDSRKMATFQQDERNVGEMYLVDTRVGHSKLETWKYPLAGDPVIPALHRVVIDTVTGAVVRFKMPPDLHRSSLCDDIACRNNEWSDVQWDNTGSTVAFVSTSRDHRHEQLRLANATTGEVKDILEESVSTFYESGNNRVNWRYLPASNEVIWFSERDNWGQLYLYDLKTGRQKSQITSGEGNVTQLLRVDEKNRVLYFMAVGKEKSRDPYFRHFYQIDFDGRNLQLLTPADADHDVTLSPDGAYFVDVYSTPDTPPAAELRNASGKLILALENADITKLLATGWKPPQPIIVKARDGTTDLYGLLYKPTNLDPSTKYPIVNHVYPGPQTGSVGARTF